MDRKRGKGKGKAQFISRTNTDIGSAISLYNITITITIRKPGPVLDLRSKWTFPSSFGGRRDGSHNKSKQKPYSIFRLT